MPEFHLEIDWASLNYNPIYPKSEPSFEHTHGCNGQMLECERQSHEKSHFPLSTSSSPLSCKSTPSHSNFELQQENVFTNILNSNLISSLCPKRRRKHKQNSQKSFFYKYHQTHGHSTNECQALKTQIQHYIDSGMSKITSNNE